MTDIRRFKGSFLWVSVVLLVLVIAFFSSIPFLIRSEQLEQLVSRTIEAQSGYAASFKQIRVSFLPTPVLRVDSFELGPSGATTAPLIRADEATFRPSIFSLLLGKPKLAHASFRNADIHYTWRDENGKFVKAVSLQDAFIDLWDISPSRPIRFKIRGKFLSDLENVNLKGMFQTNLNHFRPKDFVSKIQISLGPVEFSRLAAWQGAFLPVHLEKGTLSFAGEFLKSSGTTELEVKGLSVIQGLVYQIPPKSAMSAPGDYQFQAQAKVDLETGSLVLKEGVLMTPFGGPFNIETKFNVFKANIEEIFVKSSAMHLETLPQFLLPLRETLPVNLGFSGESQLDFFGKGSPGLFQINFRVDLTKNTLAYSKYFSKPSGTPLFLRGNLKLGVGQVLRGDFSLEFEKAALKGSLVGLDLVSGEGEMTILTNKFSIDEWQQYFPLFREFQLTGGVKVLTSVKGNFNRLNGVRVMNNISLDGLGATASNGAQIQNLSGSIDFGPLDSELKGIRFDVGNSSFSIDGKMFKQPDAHWLIGVQTPKLDARDFVFQLRKATEAVQSEWGGLDWNSIESSVQKMILPGESLERLDAQLAFGKGRTIVPKLSFDVYGGTVSARAVFDYSQANSISTIELELERLNFARMQPKNEKPILDGNLFAFATLTSKGPMDQRWLERLKGRGSLSVTNGEFHALDILGALGEIAELAPLGSFKSGVTRFNDIRGDFEVENKKIQTENLFLVSDDFQIEAVGDVSFEGNLNFRLAVYLAPALSQKISPRLGENSRLGPIPILVVGPITQPSIRKDPMLIQTFLEQLVQEQFSKITSRFIPRKPNEAPLSATREGQTSGRGKAGQSSSMEQTLLESGFNLLERFLSEKKSAS